MSSTRETLAFLTADNGDNGSRRAAAAAQERMRAEEIAHINQVINQNNDLISKAIEREKIISTLSEKITQLIDINKAQTQTIEELKLENENLKSMLGGDQSVANQSMLSSPRI